MLGVLLESRARRQRRSGGVALSVIAHLALIAAATAATARGPKHEPEKPVPVVVRFAPPPQPAPRSTPPARVTSAAAARPLLVMPDQLPRIAVPTSIPTSLPEVRLDAGASLDSLVIGPPTRGTGIGRAGRNLLEGENAGGGSEWRGSELLMRILASSKPRYPEQLRQAGVDGRVLVRFTVDTTGRVDPSSVKIVASTHDLFTRAVRQSLAGFRFKPAEVNGRRVPALAEMPFEFAISK